MNLILFNDPPFGNLLDGGTQEGTLIVLMGEKGKFSALCWSSKRIRCVVHSYSCRSAMSDGTDNAIFLATLFSELNTGNAGLNDLPLICVTDNHSLFDALKSIKQVTEQRPLLGKLLGKCSELSYQLL